MVDAADDKDSTVSAVETAVSGHEIRDVRERVARSETAIESLKADVALVRERSHSLAQEVQKLIGEIGGLSKLVERIANQLDQQMTKYGEVSAGLETHVTQCLADNAEARQERQAFRREMRKYMIGILTTALIYFLAGKLHISLTGIGP